MEYKPNRLSDHDRSGGLLEKRAKPPMGERNVTTARRPNFVAEIETGLPMPKTAVAA